MLLTLKNVKKIMGGNLLFDKLNLEVKPGEKLGLVGRNGSGKSTIFKLLTGLEACDDGQVFIRKQTRIGYLEQLPEGRDGTVQQYLAGAFHALGALQEKMQRLEEQMLDPKKLEKALSVYGEVQMQFAEAGGYEMDAHIARTANGLHIGHLLEEPFEKLSGGEKTKVGLAYVLLQQPDLLLLDEPTNHLDLAAIEWLENFLVNYQGAACVISHDQYFLDATVSRIADLEDGEVTIYTGNFTSYLKQKEAKLLQEFEAYKEQQKKMKKMKETIKRLKLWANQANPPNEGLHKRARNMERALERMEKLDRPNIDPAKMKLQLAADNRSGEDVIRLESVHKRFGARDILRDISLHLRYKERLAIVGDNGSGKSTLIKIVLGDVAADCGSVQVGSAVRAGYLPQHPLEEADASMRMIDYFRSVISVTEAEARHMLAAFMFYGYAVFQPIGRLSGGERMRLKLAIFMHEGINLLILDEPTNHLDLESRHVLEEALERFDGTVIGISHDRHLLNACFSHTAYLEDGVLHRHIGTYEQTKHHWKAVKQ
ncbi:ribosomal protection-like ABC-F family protein [Terribacillus sp. DMT04]|uniref:ribosomal protection-like ABC-F family protein n=1 Tax=Terribacillus sp. DMT04 TaxID=2850441 RepID=UPI001C2B7B11|nr:ABC-F family ATP-binding cassette domain-containing protein [Terribacillus sp. DMT04]QXE02219.1 ATP-binding cassette domain-containing protein [Terribacillus sp. DMT04]